jgi:hypothetical protein
VSKPASQETSSSHTTVYSQNKHHGDLTQVKKQWVLRPRLNLGPLVHCIMLLVRIVALSERAPWVNPNFCKYISYRTIGLRLSDCNFFCYRTIEYRTGKFEKLADYRISDQCLNLSDYQISDSQKTIGCPHLNQDMRRSVWGEVMCVCDI